MKRQIQFENLRNAPHFDVTIFGGGINGACLYDTLCRQGYRVLLLDKGDFACGTSQSSGMMIWGGLLYLRNLDFSSVFTLSGDRDHIVQAKKAWMSAQCMRYLPSTTLGRSKTWMHFGLWLYWLLGMGRRQAPRAEKEFKEQALIKPNFVKGSLAYEEVFLNDSDARFVYRWLAPHQQAGQLALNYCQAQHGLYRQEEARWQLDLKDQLSPNTYSITSRMVVNCAGVWTDQVNADFGISSSVRHVLSKGVYLGIPRAQVHDTSLFFDLGEQDDVITLVPWGPIALWGPTETAVEDIASGMQVSQHDIDFLLAHYNRRFSQQISRKDIISLRCGIRPLAVDSQYQLTSYPLDLSRQQKIIADKNRPWISCYGGKMTGCVRLASQVLALIKKALPGAITMPLMNEEWETKIERARFPGLAQPMPSAAWCAQYEQCCTLEDYLRRRTNIAQWTPRMGLGDNDCYAAAIKEIALELAHGDHQLADQLFSAYREKVITEFDSLFI